MGFFQKLSDSLRKTKDNLVRALTSLFRSSSLDDNFYDELTELLVLGDVGVKTAEKICAGVLSALVSGVTVGGKACGKSLAMNSSTAVVRTAAKVLCFFRTLPQRIRKKRAEK